MDASRTLKECKHPLLGTTVVKKSVALLRLCNCKFKETVVTLILSCKNWIAIWYHNYRASRHFRCSFWNGNSFISAGLLGFQFRSLYSASLYWAFTLWL